MAKGCFNEEEGMDVPMIIAIDGRCGSGKTYLAELIKKQFPCNICHMDDFYLPFEKRQKNWREIPAGNIDLERFFTEILRPVKAGREVVYRPYNCKKKQDGGRDHTALS